MVSSSINSVESYLNLAKSIVSKFEKKQRIEDSEMYSCACLALMDAKESFDSSKGAFSTWATRKINQHIINYLRKNKNYRKIEMLGESSTNVVDDSKLDLPVEKLSILLKDDPQDSKIDLENKKILIDHFIKNKSWADIGRSMHLSRERVRQKGQDAIAKIREKYRLIIDDLESFYFGEET
jgi:RNA polymerase sigma factor (sigma-70 family)